MALVPVLLSLAMLLADPLPLLGAILLGGMIIGRQVVFADGVSALQARLRVEQQVEDHTVRPGATTRVSLEVGCEEPARASIGVRAGLPTSSKVDDPIVTMLEPGDREASMAVEVSWPIGGDHTFDRPEVTVNDGLFRASFSTGNRPTISVAPGSLVDVHVGTGGRSQATNYGAHKIDRAGVGIEPATIRRAVPGDPVSHIDWKATARRGETHVREFDVETDRETWLVIDARAAMGAGPAGMQKLDLLRAVLLTLVENANSFRDPIGAVVIRENGESERIAPSTTTATYNQLRRLLTTVEPDRDRHPILVRGKRGRIDRGAARPRLTELSGVETAYATKLRPFFSRGPRTQDAPDEFPILHVARQIARSSTGRHLVILGMDDSRPRELRRTVRLLHDANHSVACYLTPDVLFSPTTSTDRSYERYVAFENLRRELARAAGVDVREVGPRDRLGRILAASRPRYEEVTAR